MDFNRIILWCFTNLFCKRGEGDGSSISYSSVYGSGYNTIGNRTPISFILFTNSFVNLQRRILLTTQKRPLPPTKDAASPCWLDPTTVGQMAPQQPKGDLRDHTHVIHLTSTHSFHLTLFTSVAHKTGAAPSTFRPGPTLLPPRTFLFSPSSASSVPPFFPLKKECPLRLLATLLLHL